MKFEKLTKSDVAGIIFVGLFLFTTVHFLTMDLPTPTEVCQDWLSEYDIHFHFYDMAMEKCVERGVVAAQTILEENGLEVELP